MHILDPPSVFQIGLALNNIFGKLCFQIPSLITLTIIARISVKLHISKTIPSLPVSVPPDTVLNMEPGVVLEDDHRNVSFHCDVTAGNPDELLAVRWYLDGELLREVPEENCTSEEDFGNMTGQWGLRRAFLLIQIGALRGVLRWILE